MPARSDHFAGLVARQPDNELFRFSLAQALSAEGRVPEAVPHFEFCVARKADWMMPRILLGKALVQLGRRNAARPHLEDALRLAIDQHHEDPERELRALLAELGHRRIDGAAVQVAQAFGLQLVRAKAGWKPALLSPSISRCPRPN